MSRIKLLLDVVNDMRSLADSIEALANATADGDVQKKEQPKQQTKKTAVVKESEQPAVTHEMVRELAVKLSRGGRREEIKQMLEEYGVKNVTAIKEDDLDTFYAKLSAMEAGHDTSCHCSPMQPGVN